MNTDGTQTPMGDTRRISLGVTGNSPAHDALKQGQNASLRVAGRSKGERSHASRVNANTTADISSIEDRPVSRSYVQALEGQIASLEMVIRRLAKADNAERDEILKHVQLSSAPDDNGHPDKVIPEHELDPALVTARLRAGQLRRPRPTSSAQFYGGTSLFQIHLSKQAASLLNVTDTLGPTDLAAEPDITADDGPAEPTGPTVLDNYSPRAGNFQYAPHDEISQELMATFFREQYQHHLVVYREYFLRDYDIGSGRYYSDLLLYAICALGALQYDHTCHLSDTFYGQAETLLYDSLDTPDLPTLQALVLLGYRAIAKGHNSKGWLFCGMAFRLAHEMGLHLDPNNWDASKESMRGREVLRRVYWAVFIADKQLSLYFGRPPVLHPSESDVRNTIRLQYPQYWQSLLETYLCRGKTVDEYEDGVAFIGSFIYQAELSKIVHTMITDLFENRRADMDAAVAAAKARKIHVSLTKWLNSLPGTLHWNQWTVGRVPASVLHLHMLFHTIMIILHRPPSHMVEKEGIAESEDVEICYESLQAILRLMRSFVRFHRYRSLPLDFVHILSTAAGTVMMKRFFQKASWGDPDIDKSLGLVTGAMEDIEGTWPCIREIKDFVVKARQSEETTMPPGDPLHAPDLMNGLELGYDPHGQFTVAPELAAGQQPPELGDDLGMLLTDEFLSTHVQMPVPGLDDFDFNVALE